MKISKNDIIELLNLLNFKPIEGTTKIFYKTYISHNDYIIKIDIDNEKIEYGTKIKLGDLTTSNFENSENFVVLECVDRVLEKGYSPDRLSLEHKWPMGRKEKGKLDILITDKDDKAYLMIECKTWGGEYENEKKKMQRDGGQLFSYFQQDKAAQYLCLYASRLNKRAIEYVNDIVQVDEQWATLSNQKEIFDHWNKNYKDNGIFDDWANAYDVEIKALTRRRLKELTEEDSGRIFNQFAEILRHNVVSDKPNAFNKIFNLFLCKIVDEDRKPEEELKFQWLETDTDEDLQKRLSDLYKQGMKEYLTKDVTDYNDKEVEDKLYALDAAVRDQIREMFTKLRLHKNNEFAFKEVFDEKSFRENAIVVREVVELLQPYQIRYGHKQQFLGDFFELLLSTGIKQEAGQFFTPVPVAKFIISSLPIRELIEKKIQNDETNFLPYIIDYAAGSGHFLTEAMDEVQNIIESIDPSKQKPSVKSKLKSWKESSFDWAYDYVYGVEADYRLVKTAKVSCFLHGDGLAKVIHGDGLGDFATSKEFKDLLKETDNSYPQDNKQFDIIISNPPYSVSAFKGLMDEEKSKKAFDLYGRLTDQSSEIECLFIERTKQLLKDGGVAGIILPSSILSNTGIYTQAREIILKYFDVLAIAEMGSNTFMATGTNTVILFLKRRNNADAFNIEEAIKKVFVNQQDVTINGLEKPLQKYISHVWDSISIDDYKSLLQKTPNEIIQQHDIYKEYTKKIKAKNEQELWNSILALEQNKLQYFIITYPQKLVLVKTGEKDAEKRFLGYEFSNRRGSEGIHPIQRGKTIDECTQLYDAENFSNFEKASTYIYKAFNGEFLEIAENLKSNITYQNLVDMLTFDRVDFEKNITLSVKKKVKSKWPTKSLVEISENLDNLRKPVTKSARDSGNYPYYGASGIVDYVSDFLLDDTVLLVSEDGANLKSRVTPIAFTASGKIWVNNHAHILKFSDSGLHKIVEVYLNNIELTEYITGQAQPKLNQVNLNSIKIPFPPKNIQEEIVAAIELLEKQQQKISEDIRLQKEKIHSLLSNLFNSSTKTVRLSDTDIFDTRIGKRVLKSDIKNQGKFPVYSANVFQPFGYVEKGLLNDFTSPSVIWGIDGDWMVNVIPANIPFYPTDHCGYLRIKKPIIKAKYLAFCLKEEGDQIGFSRTKRASIDRIQGIKIPLPSFKEQELIENDIENIERKIADLEKEIELIPKQKGVILKKYLE